MKSQPKISVVMASYLSDYNGAASDRVNKFIRAVDSCLNSNYKNFELIIIADGCEKTVKVLNEKYFVPLESERVRYDYIMKRPLFSGAVREAGLRMSTGDIICYLDTDDMIGESHLTQIAAQFDLEKCDWVYYNDYIKMGDNERMTKSVLLEHGSIGTSSIAHKNIKSKLLKRGISWKGCNGYGHDWSFVEKLIKYYPKHQKIFGTDYTICHLPEQLDK